MVNNKTQAYYLVNKIDEDLKLGKMENLVQQYLRSGIEIYSHQIYASTFAISNPFVKGFILADEAGLGKSMEALLIISQYYKRKNNILVIVPSPTIDTWLHNIIRTFEFRCYVLDNTERPKSESYHTSLDHFVGGIVLTTYDYVMANQDKLKDIDWQICVLDEAHRFRTYKIKENKTADAILSIIPNAKKILLTATPIQKNEDDVFGLINFIDDGIFTDYNEFHKRYFRKPQNYQELSDIIAPYTFRTLRNQVKIETKLPERQVLTQIYKMTDKEEKLYRLIQNYVDKPKRQAFPEMEEYDLCLMLFGTLSSSAYALSKTLSGIYARLNKHATEENLKEAKEIKEMLDLATSITTNQKDEMLLKAIEQTFLVFDKKKTPKKCVIFTSSTQSQDHIHKLLMLNTNYSVNSFNGTTTNEPVIKFLSSKTPSILISTDKGNESLNWQDSAFVINYDFPQVLMDMEQRISRCHRIGQLADVFVLNFICPDNFSDVRMYELFYKRFNTSQSIIGASDIIISGALDGDIETNVIDALNNVRKKKEVQIDFSELSEEFKAELDAIKIDSNNTLFNTFDKIVVEKTKNMAEIIKQKAKELDGVIKDLARFYYKDNFIDENTFEAKTSWHDKNPYAYPFKFSLVGAEGCKPFTIGSDICQKMLFDLKTGITLKPHKLVLKSDDKALKGKKGYIGMFTLSAFCNYQSTSNMYTLGLSDNEVLSHEVCDKILGLECEEFDDNHTIPAEVVETLNHEFEKQIPKILENLKTELNEDAKLPIFHIQMLAEKQKSVFEKEIKALEKEIDEVRNWEANDNFAQGFAKNQKINELSEQLFMLKDEEFFKKSKINKETKRKIEEIHNNTEFNYTKGRGYVIYFEIR